MNSTDAVIDALARAPAVVIPLVREVPPALRKRRPRSGKWSAHEHACHLAAVHALFFERLDDILAAPRPIVRPYDPGADDPPDALLGQDLDAALSSYARERERLVERLRKLTAAEWARTAEHGEYSHYSMFIMFRHLALHDFFHAYRIEELLLEKEWTDDWRHEKAEA
jgi:hypothetical protein